MPDYTTASINEQLQRTLERAMIDFAFAANGKEPLAVVVHVQWIDGAIASINHRPGIQKAQLIVLANQIRKTLGEYFDKLIVKINTVMTQKHDA